MTPKANKKLREIKHKIDVIYGELETLEKNESKIAKEYELEELEILREAITSIGNASDTLEEVIYYHGELPENQDEYSDTFKSIELL